MDIKKSTVCNIRIGKDNYEKDRNFCKNCYNNNRKKYNINNKEKLQVANSVNNTNISKKKREDVDSVKNSNNRTLIIGFSNCGKTCLMNHILIQKQEPIFIITKSLNQYPKIKAQTSEEIQPIEHYENSTVVFDDMLLSNNKTMLICFLLEDATIILIFIMFLKAIFISQKILFVIILIKVFYSDKF